MVVLGLVLILLRITSDVFSEIVWPVGFVLTGALIAWSREQSDEEGVSVVARVVAGLVVAMDLVNGRMTTEFDVDPLAIPAKVEHSVKGGKNRYEISQPAGIQLAGGGPTFNISSLNGEIRIQKSK